MSVNYKNWPDSPHNPWTIIDAPAGGLAPGDQLHFALDSSNKVYISSITCPGMPSHTAMHTGSPWKGVHLNGSGNTAQTPAGASTSFAIANVTGSTERLECNAGGEGLGTYWTAEGGSGVGPGRPPRRRKHPPKPKRPPKPGPL